MLAALAAVGAFVATAGGKSSTPVGSVFVPNPVQSSGNESLTDQKDSDAAVPASAYHDVPLTNLDGSGYLHGDYVNVTQRDRQPRVLADEHVQLHAERRPVRAGDGVLLDQRGAEVPPVPRLRRAELPRDQQPTRSRVRIDQYGGDNSFTTDHPTNEIRYGKGGVDDAEDAEVIVHEYGHAIHVGQGFQFASKEAGAISEAFGDYWAVTVDRRRREAVRRAQKEPLPCVAGLGLDVVHVDRAALPAPDRRQHALPRGPRRRGPRTTARSGRARCGTSAAARPRRGRHDHRQRLDELHRHDDAAPCAAHRRRRAALYGKSAARPCATPSSPRDPGDHPPNV